MWDLTIQDDHDFYVLPAASDNDSSYYHVDASGVTAVLVHNCNIAQIAAKHGGVADDQGYQFGSRRAARQAASEIVGDLGSRAQAIRASDFRGGPYWMKESNMVIGRSSFDGAAGWRDDFLGHVFSDGASIGRHVNVWGPGIPDGIHLFY
jgi:hypothetical protein